MSNTHISDYFPQFGYVFEYLFAIKYSNIHLITQTHGMNKNLLFSESWLTSTDGIRTVISNQDREIMINQSIVHVSLFYTWLLVFEYFILFRNKTKFRALIYSVFEIMNISDDGSECSYFSYTAGIDIFDTFDQPCCLLTQHERYFTQILVVSCTQFP